MPAFPSLYALDAGLDEADVDRFLEAMSALAPSGGRT